MTKKNLVSNMFYHVLFAVSLGNKASKMSEKFRLDRKIGFRNTFYTKCINIIIDSIGPSIILRSIYQNVSWDAGEQKDIVLSINQFKIHEISRFQWEPTMKSEE